MKFIRQCLFAPRLYKVYNDGPRDVEYQPQGLEKMGDKVLTTANTIMNITMYTSPFIFMYIIKRGFFSWDEIKTITTIFGGVGCLLATSLILRAVGRAYNPTYARFIAALSSPVTDRKAYLTELRKYDFDFAYWPVTFSVTPSESFSWLKKNPFNTCENTHLPTYQRYTIQVLAFIAVHTFGLRLVYPGSMAVIQNMLWTSLFQGRTHLVDVYNGQRAKLLTADGNTIDTMYVDKRNPLLKGKILVICCEGNSGFYEFGIMNTPVKAGYSTLGWNHPGFAESTGLPYPSQEQNAIDAVMQYAIEELGYKPEEIVLFGWSIGGYTAAWAANNYPVMGLILDATFDDLLHLAENQMPASWSVLVKEVIRSYVDLNIASLVTQYNGPVHLIRRTDDEIICTSPGKLATNRGNFLLVQLIAHRHPEVLETLKAWVSLPKLVALSEIQRENMDHSQIAPFEKTLLRLIAKYASDHKSSHCTPLTGDHFNLAIDTILAEAQ